VNAEAPSGALEIADVSGAVQARTSSGSLELRNIGGELRASASSGQINGTNLQHVREVQTSSGAIRLQGVFNEAAQVRASSGSVQVTFAPDSAVVVNVRTRSGRINQRGGLKLENLSSGGGTLGSPAAGATLSIQTDSGSVTLTQ
jgi:DUF4097 and DUF4098 domain-containing protein YvlB